MHVQAVFIDCPDHDCKRYEKCFYSLLNSSFFGVSEKTIYPGTSKHYNNCSVRTFLILFKKLLGLPPFKEEGRDYAFYMRDCKGETSHNFWKIIWKMIYLISIVIFIFLTQIYCNINFITSSSNFITRFPWHFEINLCQLLLEDYFLWRAKMHIPKYVWKTCLKELQILLKCREPFEKSIADVNSSKNVGLL